MSTKTPATKTLLNLTEAAAYCGLSKQTFFELYRAIPHMRFGPKTIRFEVADLDRFKQQHTQYPTQEQS
jgi:predicted DNA-binding transcriptional regulator AlpA